MVRAAGTGDRYVAVGTQGWRKWLAFGTGVAIEIGDDRLDVAIVRVRPDGVELAATHRIEKYRDRPATEWGEDYAGFLRRHGLRRHAALALLPRHEVIVRCVSLPGVDNKALDAAMRFQLDGLHPYPEEEAVSAWSRLDGSPQVLVAIARWDAIDRWSSLFAEAGVPLAAFSFSAACLYTAARVLSSPKPEGFFAFLPGNSGVEAYGESPATALLSSLVDLPAERACSLVSSQLRLSPESVPVEPASLLPEPRRAPREFDLSAAAVLYAAAITAACPHLALGVNLLPQARRVVTSRLLYAPTAGLAALLALAAGLLLAQQPYEDRKHLRLVQSEVAKAQKRADRLRQIDVAIEDAKRRIELIDSFKKRSKADADALRELTSLVNPPAWASSVALGRTQVTVQGEAEQAAPLIEVFDKSPLFRNSEFLQGISKTASGEGFTIRAQREAESSGGDGGEQKRP